MGYPEIQRRVIIRAHVQQIPGSPPARSSVLGELFAEKKLGRALRQEIGDHGIDATHILPGFESEEDTKGWFMYNFGVNEYIDKSQLVHIPHELYYAHYDEANKNW
jgi:hypothetical protein